MDNICGSYGRNKRGHFLEILFRLENGLFLSFHFYLLIKELVSQHVHFGWAYIDYIMTSSLFPYDLLPLRKPSFQSTHLSLIISAFLTHIQITLSFILIYHSSITYPNLLPSSHHAMASLEGSSPMSCLTQKQMTSFHA